MLEIGSAKCHVLDLLVSGVCAGAGTALQCGDGEEGEICEGEGLQQRRGCGPEITQRLLMEPGLAVLERGTISASKRSPLLPPFGTIRCDYKAELCRDDDDDDDSYDDKGHSASLQKHPKL